MLHFSQIREKHQILDTVSFLCWRLICSRRNTRWQWKSTFSNWVQQAYRINLKWALPFKSREPLFQSPLKFCFWEHSIRLALHLKQTPRTCSHGKVPPTTLSWKCALPDPSTSMRSWRRPSSRSLETKQIEFKSFDWTCRRCRTMSGFWLHSPENSWTHHWCFLTSHRHLVLRGRTELQLSSSRNPKTSEGAGVFIARGRSCERRTGGKVNGKSSLDLLLGW